MWVDISLFVLLVSYVHSNTSRRDLKKSSIAFVIDDTSSMTEDIDGVKNNTRIIFDAVYYSNNSQIDNYVLVTFNDPAVTTLAVTKDRNLFNEKLAPIKAHNVINPDCEEYSMSGIERALQVSHDNSFLYVFTDASSKDYYKLAQVQSLAVKKKTEISFFLTDDCGTPRGDRRIEAFYTLAKASNGHIFQLKKQNTGQVLKYIANHIESKKLVLLKEQLSAGHHDIKFALDSTVQNAAIVVTGDRGSDPTLKVLSPDGTAANYDILVDIPNNKVINLKRTQTGNYTASVYGKTLMTVSVEAETSLDFDYGFSVFKTSFLNATSTRPLPGRNSNLLLQLETPDKIKVIAVYIADVYTGNIIRNLDAKVLDETTKTYIVEKFVPPTVLFNINIIAENTATGERMKRYSNPIQAQTPDLEPVVNKPPTVQIIENSKVSVYYNKSFQFTCKVNAYPKPLVIWEDINSGKEMKSNFSVVEPPYDFVGILELPAVESDGKYRCKATSNGITATKDVEVTVIKIFDIIETPKELYKIEYNKEGTIPCKVNALPQATVTWTFNGKQLTNMKGMAISEDKITIKQMRIYMQGKYSCIIKNDFNTKVTDFTIQITGYERPKIQKNKPFVSALEGSDAILKCKLSAGKPKPKVTWPEVNGLKAGQYELLEENTVLKIKNVKREHSGKFKCVARNVVAGVLYKIGLNVEYPPKIEKAKSNYVTLKGDPETLRCFVDGIPRPQVVWTLNGTKVETNKDRRIYGDNSIKIQSSPSNIGTFECEAKNKHGDDSQIIKVAYAEPAFIQSPATSIFNVNVNEDLNLPCNVQGYPLPTIEWTFQDSNRKMGPLSLKAEHDGSLALRKIQLNSDGYYICKATNVGGSYNIGYTVHVLDAPKIVNIVKLTYRAVVGDTVLRIPCNATGRPKPDITWTVKGFPVAKGTEFFDIDADGTLIIKNIDMSSQGEYTCTAANSLGEDEQKFAVEINEYPYEMMPTTEILANQGERLVVNCSLPRSFGSTLRWYKGSKLVREGDLVINDASIDDSGVYMCRVTNFAGARSSAVNITVNSPPVFRKDPETTIDFEEELYAYMDCSHDANPSAKTEWYHKGNKINTNNDIYVLTMSYDNIGSYACIVSNSVGTITRTFVVKLRGCAINVQDDFNGNAPLLKIADSVSLKKIGDVMYIPENYRINLACPTMFTKIPMFEVTATCKEDSNFVIDKISYNFSDLKCLSPSIPIVQKMGISCGTVGTEVVDVGFNIGGRLTKAYEVCFDKNNKIPVYVKNDLPKTGSGVIPKSSMWFDNYRVPFDFSAMYQCDRQARVLGGSVTDTCCFGKRQLINPKDVLPGLSQMATYNYLNVVPQWNTCNSENWDDMEDRVRSLAGEAVSPLTVWTGQAGSAAGDVVITDGRNSQPVPKFLWKVIQDNYRKSSVAIIQINVAGLTRKEVSKYVMCKNICNRLPWMTGGAWSDITRGFIYCCRIEDFVKVFGFQRQFSHGPRSLLTSVTYIPRSTLTL